MRATDIIQKAKMQLVLTQPFFASLALKCEYIEDSTVKTASINGKRIRYNPEFVETLGANDFDTIDLCMGLLAHEVMHTALLHHLRQGDREHGLWNKAGDYCINQLLVDANIRIPRGGLLDPQYKGWMAEAVYAAIKPEEKQEEQEEQSGEEQEEQPEEEQEQGDQESQPTDTDPEESGTGEADGEADGEEESDEQPIGSGSASDGPPKPEEWGEVEPFEGDTTEAEAEAKQDLVEAVNAARSAGKVPGDIERLVDEILKPIIPWEEILNRFVAEMARNDYSWSRPNPRYAHTGFCLPVLENKEVGNIVMIVDTSGSIDQKLLNKFSSELGAIANILTLPVNVLYVDSKLRGEEELVDGEPLHPKGGGGTDFRPGFEHINTEGIDCRAVIYFTDGYCDDYPSEPDYPVLWAVYDHKRFTPPFGEVVMVD